MSSQSSHTGYGARSRFGGRICYCGEPSPVRTARTNGNYGRRFVGCGFFGVGATCGYFEWVDPPMCDRAREVIPTLVTRINLLKREIEISRRRKRLYRNAFVGSCCALFILGLLYILQW